MNFNNQKLSIVLAPIFWIVSQALFAYVLLNLVINTYELYFNNSWNFQDVFTLLLFIYELAFGIVILNVFFTFTRFQRQSIEGVAAVFIVFLWFLYEFGSDFKYTPLKTTLYLGITIFSFLWPILWERNNL